MWRAIIPVFISIPLWADVNLEWVRYYGGSDDDGASAITMDGDGNYVVAGYTYSFGSGYSDGWLLKIDPSSGDTIWTRVMGGSSSEGFQDVAVDDQNNYILVGYTYSYGNGGSDVWVVKMDRDGNVLWSRTYGTSEDEGAHAVGVDSSGNYVIAAYRTVSGYRDAWILKVDADSGEVLWDISLGGSENDEFQSVLIDGDGNYVLAGHARSYGNGYFDVWLVKMSPDGNVLWSRAYGHSLDDGASGIGLTGDGNYIVSGRAVFDIGDYNDVWILKVNPDDGDTLWTARYGTSEPDGATGVDVDGADNYVFSAMTGASGSWDAWILKTNSNGDTLWTFLYGGSESDGATDIAIDSEGKYGISGYTYSYGNGFSDVLVFRLGETVSLGENAPHLKVIPRRGGFILMLPDVFRKGFSLKVFSAGGREIPLHYTMRENSIHIDLSAGVYFFLLNAGGKVFRGRVVVY